MRWDFHPSPWSVGTWVVGFDGEEEHGGSVICFVPPGTSAHGEGGLDVARWRRAYWSHEAFFVTRSVPDRLESVALEEVCAALPAELVPWVERETAAHVDRLRGFARSRPHARGVSEAAAELFEELEAARPEALERYCLEADTEALQAEMADEPPLRPRRDVLDPRSMRRGEWGRLALQLSLLTAVYLAYRELRPTEMVTAFNPSVRTLLWLPLREVLLLLYGALHVPLTVGFLVWIYFRRNSAFGFIRNALLIAVLLALPFYLAMAAARPRPEQWVPALAVPTTPALHLAVALIIGFAGVRLFRHTSARVLSVLYPVAVVWVIAATATGWIWITLAGACLATAASWLAAAAIGRRIATSRQPPTLAIRPGRRSRGDCGFAPAIMRPGAMRQ